MPAMAICGPDRTRKGVGPHLLSLPRSLDRKDRIGASGGPIRGPARTEPCPDDPKREGPGTIDACDLIATTSSSSSSCYTQKRRATSRRRLESPHRSVPLGVIITPRCTSSGGWPEAIAMDTNKEAYHREGALLKPYKGIAMRPAPGPRATTHRIKYTQSHRTTAERCEHCIDSNLQN